MENFIQEETLPSGRQRSIKSFFWPLIVVFLAIGVIMVWWYFNFNKKAPAPPTVTKSSQPIAGKCLILEEKYCSTAEWVKWQHPRGYTMEFVVFRLPIGTPIFAPLPGDVATGGKSLVNPEAVVVTITNPSDPTSGPTVSMHGDIRPQEKIYATLKGDILGVIDNNGITVLGDYNLVVSITMFDKENRVSVTTEMLKSIFPANSL